METLADVCGTPLLNSSPWKDPSKEKKKNVFRRYDFYFFWVHVTSFCVGSEWGISLKLGNQKKISLPLIHICVCARLDHIIFSIQITCLFSVSGRVPTVNTHRNTNINYVTDPQLCDLQNNHKVITQLFALPNVRFRK